jgi:Transposase
MLIDRFLSQAARSRLEPFVRLNQTIRKHRDGILAAIRLGINQGRTEALNNKVRLITRRAYGFHSAKAALALVLLTCGPITPSSHHTNYTHERESPTSIPREPLFGTPARLGVTRSCWVVYWRVGSVPAGGSSGRDAAP